MKQQLTLLLTAVMFYTRIPVPRNIDHSDDLLNKSTRYFPAIGYIVGGFAVLLFWLSSLALPLSMAVLISMIATIWLTGAFHEDGFADVCDGFGGGWSAEQILTIMKDSRLGTYGAIGLVGMLALKFMALTALPQTLIIPALIIGHVASRWTAVNLIRFSRYARLDATSKTKPVGKLLDTPTYLVATLTALPVCLLIPDWPYLAFIIPLPLLVWRLKHYFEKWIGGFTGDCLGATQQLAEVVIYLAFVIITQQMVPSFSIQLPWN